MPLHSGKRYEVDGVRIGPPDVAAVARAPRDDDVAASVERWLSGAQRRGDVHYFSVYERTALVGQIFLHDIDAQQGEALIGYHLFERRFRGRGIGTKMLALLLRYVREETTLRRLVVITSDDLPLPLLKYLQPLGDPLPPIGIVRIDGVLIGRAQDTIDEDAARRAAVG